MNAATASQAVVRGASPPEVRFLSGYDHWLIGCILLLMSLGLVMVASASVTVADRQFHEPLHYFWRQLGSVGAGLVVMLVLMKLPLRLWQPASSMFLFLGLSLLLLVLIPGLGHEVNGSMRWVRLGPLTLQASEPVKLCAIIYLAGYLVRHGEQVRSAFVGFIKPMGVLTVLAGLLLLEPDFGATVVLFATTLGMLFMGGVPLVRFTAWGLTAVAALVGVAMLAPYRVKRLLTFMDPWADPYNSGFQLIQSLIAMGRGEWLGVGLGASVQKLFYLPEAHTDFIFAVLAEEFGLAGCVLVIVAFTFIIWRSFQIGAQAGRAGDPFAAYLAYGIGLLVGLQAMINIGVNMGVLPTKGLTLPFISYGSNSLIVTSAAMGLLLRIGYESGQPAARQGDAYV